MRRAIVIAWLAGCGTPTVPTANHQDPATARDATAGSTVVAPTPKLRAERIEAPHGGAIVELAATPDGKAVVSLDELGGVRLWPALDGSVEPRVVDLAQPVKLAILARGDGFVIAAIDAAGGLSITHVDRDGLTRQRAGFPVEPGYAGVAAFDSGFLAWRLDQRVMKLGADGAIAHELPGEPGARVVAIAVAGSRAVAVVESAKPARQARWLTIGDKLAWGRWITAGDVALRVALSPSGKRLAYLTPSRQVMVYATDTGALVANEPGPTALGLGLPDDSHVAIAFQGGVNWIDLAKAKPKAPTPVTSQVFPDEDLPLAIGGGRAISAVSGELVLAVPMKLQYLGYQLESPSVATAAPNGGLLIGLHTTFASLDAKLATSRSSPDLMIPEGSGVADLKWLTGDEWLVESSRTNDGVTAIALVDTKRKKSVVVRSGLAMVQMLMHEPTTKLVTLSLGDQPEVLRHEPGTGKLVKISALPRPAGFERSEIIPVVPARANALHLVVVHMRERLVIRWVADPRDAAGHVFVWQNVDDGKLELLVLANGKRIGTLPTDGPTALFPDRDGARILLVSQRSVSLVNLDGRRVWSQAIQGVTEALWLDDGGLAIISAVGIARLDPATGELVAARCGWQFGLTTKPHPVTPRFETLCTQLRP